MPFIFESYDFSRYDLVISIGGAECKGIITKPETIHIHYCLTPTRYLYSHASDYLSNPIYRFIARPLRAWDQVAATRPDIMIAISTQVKRRIQKYYNRDSSVIFPPVDTKLFATPVSLCHCVTSPYYLVVSRLVPYKKIDLIIRAFNHLPSQKLLVIGTGSEERRLKKMAQSNTTFLDFVEDKDLPSYYQHAKAFIQINEEDFGISMVEAQAAGIPVIAFGVGGAEDIVIPGRTGLLLADNSVKSLVSAIDNFSKLSFDRGACQENARRFDQIKWKKQILAKLAKYVAV